MYLLLFSLYSLFFITNAAVKEDASELTIKSVVDKVIKADGMDLKFCKFKLANYEGTGSITQQMVDKHMYDMAKKHAQAGEQAIHDAVSVGIKNEGFFYAFNKDAAAPPEAKLFDSNMDLLMGGAKEMVKIFTSWAEQGPELNEIIHWGDNSAKFNEEAGMTNSQVRLARNIYCVKKLALNVKDVFKDADAAKGITVNYAITTVWIGQRSVPKMQRVASVSKVLENMVNSAVGDNLNRGELHAQRRAMAKAILELAVVEDQMMPSAPQLDDIGRGLKRGSSMAMMGVIYDKGQKDNAQWVQFFHVHSDDEYLP